VSAATASSCRTPPPQQYQQPPPGYQQQPPPQGGYGQAQPAQPQQTVAVTPMQPSANVSKDCAELGKKGLAEFAKRDYAHALEAFEAAIKSGNDVAAVFNKGLCLYMLHRPQDALTALQLYVDRAPQAANRNQADALIADLHRQLGND
jgi:tetratricopeptide (TPR) repeat protein